MKVGCPVERDLSVVETVAGREGGDLSAAETVADTGLRQWREWAGLQHDNKQGLHFLFARRRSRSMQIRHSQPGPEFSGENQIFRKFWSVPKAS